MSIPLRQPVQSTPRGSIILLVMVSIVIMTLATSTYLVLMRNEHAASRYSGQQLQAQAAADSGVEYLRTFLSQSDLLIAQQGGYVANPGMLQGVLVADDLSGAFRSRFTVLAPDIVQGFYTGVRYGLENESAKLNINMLAQSDMDDTEARQRLMMLPGMTFEIADAILDWIDSDDSPRPYGAEREYYMSLSPPFEPRNGPIQSLDELLMVRGVTPELLYGVDANRNYLVDTNEQPRGALLQLDNSFGELDRGWSAYLTVYSAESTVAPTGEAKINVNFPDLAALHAELLQVMDENAANFIIAYRQYGPAAGGGTGAVGDSAFQGMTMPIDFSVEPTTSIESLLDLVGVQVAIPQGQSGAAGPQGGGPAGGGRQGGNASAAQPQPAQAPGGRGGGRRGRGGGGGGGGGAAEIPPVMVMSPWLEAPESLSNDFLIALDNLTITDDLAVPGRVNINQAPRSVLLTLPNITESVVDQIINLRETAVDPVNSLQRHAVWLVANNVLTLDEFRQLDPHITAGGDVYSAQVVGFFDSSTPRVRYQVVFDRSTEIPQIVGFEDLTYLGPGFSGEVLGAVPDFEP